jgi:hypothetical protein
MTHGSVEQEKNEETFNISYAIDIAVNFLAEYKEEE